VAEKALQDYKNMFLGWNGNFVHRARVKTLQQERDAELVNLNAHDLQHRDCNRILIWPPYTPNQGAFQPSASVRLNISTTSFRFQIISITKLGVLDHDE
jgi:hypothetical protein